VSCRGSYLIDKDGAEAAVTMALPLILEGMKRKEVGESGFLYIVVMNPALRPTSSSFEDAILYEHAIGDKAKWDSDYASFARAKAHVTWKTGIDSHALQELHPYLLEAGDTVLWGSVAIDGIVVGVSGANPWYDEAFAGAIAMCLRAISKARIIPARKGTLFLAS